VNRILPLVLFPPVLAVEAFRVYVDALRRNSGGFPTRLLAVPRDEGAPLLPVCSCCRLRALRPAGTGVICPDCDRPPPPVDTPQQHPPTEGTNGGV
jgi:hypothetical protein